MSTLKKNKDEITWNLINAALAGGLVLLGSFSDGDITIKGVLFAFVAGMIVAVSKFKDYWTGQEAEYNHKAFSFIHF